MHLGEKQKFVASSALHFLPKPSTCLCLQVSVVADCNVSLAGSVLCCPTVEYSSVWVWQTELCLFSCTEYNRGDWVSIVKGDHCLQSLWWGVWGDTSGGLDSDSGSVCDKRRGWLFEAVVQLERRGQACLVRITIAGVCLCVYVCVIWGPQMWCQIEVSQVHGY